MGHRAKLPSLRPALGRAEALAAIGIDLDEVRTRIEATFGPGALSRAVPPHQRGRNGPARRRFLHRSRRGPGRTGPDAGPVPVRGHIPFTPRAKKVLELSLREAVGLGDNYIGIEHVALALIRIHDGVVPRLLAGLDVSTGHHPRRPARPAPQGKLTAQAVASVSRSIRLASPGPCARASAGYGKYRSGNRGSRGVPPDRR